MLVPTVSFAELSIIAGDYSVVGRPGDSGITGTYAGEIDIASQTGTLQSGEPLSGADWTANITQVFIYDDALGGEQSFSWDITTQTWFDISNNGQVIVCYIENSSCDAISADPSGIFLGEATLSHPFTMNQPGQFAIGSFISWTINEIPTLMTLQSLSNTLDPTATTFISFDGDNNGIPGYAFIAGPFFSGTTFAFSGQIGKKEGIFASDILIDGGNLHECSSTEGTAITASSDVTVINDSIESIQWLLNDTAVATGASTNIFAPLGINTLTMLATATSGKTVRRSASVTIQDSIAPDVKVEFIDKHSQAVFSTIDREHLTNVVANFGATDVCDPQPIVNATGGFTIESDSQLPVTVHNDDIILNVHEITVSAVATDASGNNSSSSATLNIE